MSQIKLKEFLFGVAYYPEHWDQKYIEHDIERMSEAGVNVVRMGEFAWDRFEPVEREFDFTLFDEVIDKFAEANIKVILATPTATPPRWLTHGHSDWFRVDENGRRMDHGSRQHCCTNNEDFRHHCRRITRSLAEHYANNPNVIGWQIDNEFFCHFHKCCCNACIAKFRSWLQSKYITIEGLNSAWGTSFWGLTYSDFEQIPQPYDQNRPAYPNPSAELDYYRFISDAVTEFASEQVSVLRKCREDWWITHNIVDVRIDYHTFAKKFDFLSVDIYPGFGKNDYTWASRLNDLCRSVSSGYIVAEQQSGPGGQKSYSLRNPEPGQMRLWTYQSIAHGADGIIHFRWRTCRFGAEMYWIGILDHDDVPRRRYEEFTIEGKEMVRIGPKILGTSQFVNTGVFIEFDQDCSHNTMPQDFCSPRKQAELAYGTLTKLHIPCGLTQVGADFEALRFLVLPSMPLIDSVFAKKLKCFVKNGGVLLITARSAVRDRNNHVLAMTPPGFIGELAGVNIEEFGKVDDELFMSMSGEQIDCCDAAEVLAPTTAKVVGTWQKSRDNKFAWTVDKPAMTVNSFGKGKVIYAGTYLNESNSRSILGLALKHCNVQPLVDCSETVEVTLRKSVDHEYLFILNHSSEPNLIKGLPEGTDMITLRKCSGQIKLGSYEVAIIQGQVT